MLPPITCFTCGSSTGDIATIYHIVRQKRMAIRYGTEGAPTVPTQAGADPTLTDNQMKDVLDALKVSSCCRVHIVTGMLFSEHY
jgi:DNA-directed RNA polymerase subunit N (RpoN/RPB10)